MDDDKITKTFAGGRLREAKREEDADPEEIAALEHLVQLYSDEAAAKKAAKEAQTELDRATLNKYATSPIRTFSARARRQVGRRIGNLIGNLVNASP